jgi:hypothetical protein
MNKKQEPFLSSTHEEKIPTKNDSVDDLKENNIEAEEPVQLKTKDETKKNWFKRKIDRIDKYLYDIEVIFSTDPEIKMEKKARNIYILKSSLSFIFCFLFSYSLFTGYFYIVEEINKTQTAKIEQIESNGGIPMVFSSENISNKN